MTLNVRDAKKWTVLMAPSKPTYKKLKWSTSDSSCATVNNGIVYAKGEGTAVITVKAQDGSNKASSCVVNVRGQDTSINTPKVETPTVNNPTVYTQEELVNKYLNSSVKVFSYNQGGNLVSTGSGFFINVNGTVMVVTNYHVIDGDFSARIEMTNGMTMDIGSV